jgi:hypothetical protein
MKELSDQIQFIKKEDKEFPLFPNLKIERLPLGNFSIRTTQGNLSLEYVDREEYVPTTFSSLINTFTPKRYDCEFEEIMGIPALYVSYLDTKKDATLLYDKSKRFFYLSLEEGDSSFTLIRNKGRIVQRPFTYSLSRCRRLCFKYISFFKEIQRVLNVKKYQKESFSNL